MRDQVNILIQQQQQQISKLQELLMEQMKQSKEQMQRSQQLVTLLSLTVIHPLGNRGFLLTGKMNFPGSRVEVV